MTGAAEAGGETRRDMPTIGILGHETSLRETMSPVRLRALLGEAALRGVRLCFFQSRECDRVAGRARLHRFVDGGWCQEEAGLPDLVVAAGSAVRPEHHEAEAWLRQRTRLIAFHIQRKHEDAGMLASSPATAGLVVPEEVLAVERLEQQLEAWLGRGPLVVKRSDGSLGTGIFFAIPAGEEIAVHSDARVWQGSPAAAVARLAGAVRARMAYRTYIVQRYIETRDAHGQPATIRADIVRQPDGGWHVYRLTARIAIGAKLVSNRARGSAMVDIESYLAARGVADPAGRRAEIEAQAAEAAQTLARAPGLADVYEYGIDFAPDPDLRLWFLDGNQRPLTHGAEVERAGHVLGYWLSRLGR